ncbi:Crp/Fnr family transcriptional regulator [Sphingobium sp. 10 DY56-G10]|uniref:Crp/Fnr family transcriptional regulator n=1 Tax=Sphingomonadales TaxID=204457 RepID=UPI00055B6650|nr:Crp/Fnr family transcriptional regulator [Sphingomonas sp. SKA58]
MSAHQALQLFVRKLSERSCLNQEERRTVLELEGQEVEYAPHRDIVRPGELTDFCCLIISGMAARFGQLPDGTRQITAVYIAGDMCDLYSLMLPKVEWALQALSSRLVLLKVPHRKMQDIVHAYPAVAEAFWRDCVADASILSQWVVNIGRRDALMRTAHLFCELGLRIEIAGLGRRTAFQLPVIQSQMADALGITPVHMNRVIRALRQQGLLTVQGRDVQVPDWNALAHAGGFESGYLAIDQRWRTLA